MPIEVETPRLTVRQVLLGLNNGAWLIKPNDHARYFLQGTFNGSTQKEDGRRQQWHGPLSLPKVEIPLTPLKAKTP